VKGVTLKKKDVEIFTVKTKVNGYVFGMIVILSSKKMESQCNQIKAHLQSGRSITALEALYKFGCFNLKGRIWDLKQRGLKIKTEMTEVTSPSVFNNKKRFAKYTLIK
jgi:hypothetical protein